MSSEATFAQNPFYDPLTNCLYMVDLIGKDGYKYSIADDVMRTVNVNGVTISQPGFLMPIEGSDDEYAITTGNSVIKFIWDGVSPTGTYDQTVFSVPPDTLINGAMAMPTNYFYVANYGPKYCANESVTHNIYGFSSNGMTTQMNRLISTVGMAYADGVMYNLDACTGILWGSDWNSADGAMCKSQCKFPFK